MGLDKTNLRRAECYAFHRRLAGRFSAHLKHSSSGNRGDEQRPLTFKQLQWDWQTGAFAIALAALGFALFALPGVTVQGYGFSDLFTFFGWINALEHGRLPHVDFRAPLGALSHFLPYLVRRRRSGPAR